MGEQGKRKASAIDNLLVGLAYASYNEDIVMPMRQQCIDTLTGGNKGKGGRIFELQVPGSLELAHALRAMAGHDPAPHVLIALGCVIRGDTTHYDIVCHQSALSVARVGEGTGIPVINGILTCEDRQQAIARAEKKGEEFASAALAMAEIGRVEPY